ncbi:MAG: lipoyl(octanoyl) transferase LipB [Hyphomicrobiaceae bacterium]
MPPPVSWLVSTGPIDYEMAVAAMERRVAAIAEKRARELVWLLEHPPLYTAGTSARAEDLVDPDRFPVHHSGRGGQYTYHGPGQRVVYAMLDLERRGRDVRRFVDELEGWVIDTLASLGVSGETRPGRVGVWVRTGVGSGDEKKIAAVGIRLRRWVSFHGLSLNVSPDLSHFDGIVPCGLAHFGVTSLAALGRTSDMAVVDDALRRAFEARFGARTETVTMDEAGAL